MFLNFSCSSSEDNFDWGCIQERVKTTDQNGVMINLVCIDTHTALTNAWGAKPFSTDKNNMFVLNYFKDVFKSQSKYIFLGSLTDQWGAELSGFAWLRAVITLCINTKLTGCRHTKFGSDLTRLDDILSGCCTSPLSLLYSMPTGHQSQFLNFTLRDCRYMHW